ncbi:MULTISPECIES: Scr1 family TA system antitoxin-like transcriptional regulator [unclassified Streptomyces]|uniref:Scr1 family TA system antitoxin-like transcriptional regulator n=1 Tax=unclassified Streptomyces TaxID=2593676 RepID=UPI0035DB8B88
MHWAVRLPPARHRRGSLSGWHSGNTRQVRSPYPWERKEQLDELIRLSKLRNVELQVMPLEHSEHAGLGGPFILLTPARKPQVGYLEVQNISRLITDPEEVRILASRYGCIRSQALTPRKSSALIERLLKDQ